MIRSERPLWETEDVDPAAPLVRSRENGEASPAGESARPGGRLGGYRLKMLEVLNWGTFDRQVYSIHPGGQTTLLVGQNGSGKSTLVDALLTLLVRPGVRNFNVAAGAKKRERTEKSYFEGAFDRNSDEDGRGIKTQCLRAKKNHTSVILACFHNADGGRAFTLAQVFYWTGQNVETVYCFSEDERSIVGDFGGLESADTLLKTLKGRGLQVTKKFADYERWLKRVTHVKAKAMEVFNQTVAVKDIQRLNDFIRNHMLESHNWSERVDGLLGHFTELNEAHQSLVRARQQSELLDPIAATGGEFRAKRDDLQDAEAVMNAVDAFFSQRTIDVFTPELERLRQRKESVSGLKYELAREIDEVQEQCRQLRNEIEQAGGERLRQIPLLIETERLQLEGKRTARERYESALTRCGLAAEAITQQSFSALREAMPALRRELEERLREHDARREEVILRRGELRRDLAGGREELEGLSQRRDSLPQWCINLRGDLCAELGLPAGELPFVAELVSVSPDERAWEASIEKVLRSIALSLLVPERHYLLFSRYVDRTKLTSQGRGQRLVYQRVGAQSPPENGAVLHQQSLLRKLVFREGHPLLPWVKGELAARCDYRCCETVEEFQSCRGLALTRSRHVKSGSKRHDKDDREQTLDPRNFVLGWDNREKKRSIAQEIARLERAEEQLCAQIARLEGELGELRERLTALGEAESFSNFAEVFYERHAEEMDRLERERRAIEEQSDAIRCLKERLQAAHDRRQVLQDERDDAVAEERELGVRIAQAEKLIAGAQAELEKLQSDGMLKDHRDRFARLEALLEARPLDVDNFFEARERLRRSQESRVNQLRREVEPLKGKLTTAMSRFLQSFPEETDLVASCEYLDSFLGLRRRIAEDDLPRHERRFKDRLNEKVTHEIGLFRGALEKERRGIEDKIEMLNLSLRQLEYRPGTHIQLEPRPVRDPEIVEFQRKLKECVEGSFEDTPEANEARFLRIRDLVLKLQDENNRRWRDKVTDVRRWFDFVANVVDQISLERVSSYDDSTGQSGGEKAKLAFTILVAAIAYQYDLDFERPQSDRFHFVVVDEMFSKVDDQHAEYALELFKQFGLQLLIVAPLDAKARVTQPYVGSYVHVSKRENRSDVLEMSARQFEEIVDESANTAAVPRRRPSAR